ncbi:MAG: hypothetical protein IJ808_04660 [Muribaculaceae bacterium]|nr:hypothetical protein [Muribaculaceae bacterium]
MNYSAIIIIPSDMIMASLQVGNKKIINFAHAGFMSFNQVKDYVLRLAGRFSGLAHLTVRNQSQGWSVSIALATSRELPAPVSRPAKSSVGQVGSLFPVGA